MKHTLVPLNDGSGLYRIIGEGGRRGGRVKSSRNLSQDGRCWIGEYATVTGEARVRGDAVISGFAIVSGSALIDGDADVNSNAHVFGDTRVSDSAKITGAARVGGKARVSGGAVVGGTAKLLGTRTRIVISGNARVFRGVWFKSPFYCQGTLYSVTHSGPNQITIGCQTHSFKKWLKLGRRFSRDMGLSEKEHAEYAAIVRLIIKLSGGVK